MSKHLIETGFLWQDSKDFLPGPYMTRDAARPRLERILRTEGRKVTGSRTGAVGFVRIIPMTGPMAGKNTTLRADDYYRRDYWEPERYWAWQDEVWKAPRQEKVDVGEVQQVQPRD